MELFFYPIVILVVLIPIALYLILRPVFKNQQTVNGVVNYNSFMRKYVFQIELDQMEFYDQLKTQNVHDIMEYCLSDDCTEIVFTRYNTRNRYKLMIDERNNYIILKVQQVSVLSRVPYYINEFFMRKFGAKPMEYEKYPF